MLLTVEASATKHSYQWQWLNWESKKALSRVFLFSVEMISVILVILEIAHNFGDAFSHINFTWSLKDMLESISRNNPVGG